MGSGGFSYPFQDHQHLQTQPVKKQGDHKPQITVARFMWAHKDASMAVSTPTDVENTYLNA